MLNKNLFDRYHYYEYEFDNNLLIIIYLHNFKNSYWPSDQLANSKNRLANYLQNTVTYTFYQSCGIWVGQLYKRHVRDGPGLWVSHFKLIWKHRRELCNLTTNFVNRTLEAKGWTGRHDLQPTLVICLVSPTHGKDIENKTIEFSKISEI